MAIFNSGVRGKRAKDGVGIVGSQAQFIQQESPLPTITSFSIDGSDDLALDPAGGQTVVVHGTGFAPGMTGIVGSTAISAITVVSPTKVTFTSTAKSAGSYTLTLANSNGSAAILVPGIVYSSVPTFSTSAGSIGNFYETKPISTSVSATSDTTVTYSLVSGALPTGATLNSNGTITGTSPVENASTTYNFSIKATDAELQDVTRSFTLTINTDVVTWIYPSSGASILLEPNLYSANLSASSAAGYSIASYSANALPSGLTLTNGVISGTPDTEQTLTSLLTATSTTTNRSATNIVTWTVTLGDLNWVYNSLLLSTSNSLTPTSFITDSSLNNALVTVVGDTRAQNFHPYQHGFYGVDFPASGSYLTGSHSYLNVSATTSVWTFECWMFPRTSSVSVFAIGAGSAYSNSIEVNYGRTTASKFAITQGNGSSLPVSITSTNTYLPNTWYHVAVTRTSAGVITLWINGQSAGTQTYNAATVSAGTTFVVNGTYDNNGLGANGSSVIVSNLRFVTGISMYSTAFTPSTTPLTVANGSVLLLCQSNRFIDNAAGNALTIAGTPAISASHPFSTKVVPTLSSSVYSYYFNGSSYLSFANDVMLLGTTWTIEAWIYPMSGAKQQIISAGNTGCYIETLSSYLRLSKWTNGSNGGNYGGQLLTNAWNHVVWMNTGDGVVRGYTNGIPVVASGGYAINTVNTASIGAAGDGTMKYTGYICNLRVVKGTAIYNSAGFAVPSAPLTAITNTVLLTCASNTIVDNSSTNITLTQTGTVSPVQFYPQFSPALTYSSTAVSTTIGSAYFDGTGDYLTTSYVPNLTGDFTIEFWINCTSWPSSPGRMILNDAAAGGGTYLYYDGTTVTFNVQGGNNFTSTVSVPTNSWAHWAITRQSGTLRFFINGLSQTITLFGTTGTSTFFAYALALGGYNANYITGYMADVRFVNGTALYTSNFVPNASPLTAVAKTTLLTLQNNGSHNNSTFKDQSNFNNIITRNGNVTNSTSSPYGDNWSAYFDGSAGWLQIASTASQLDLGSGDFTIEFWMYALSWPSTTGALFGKKLSDSTSGWVLFRDAASPTKIDARLGSTNNFYTGSAVTTNQWQHWALVRSGSTIKWYLNGVLDATSTNSVNLADSTGSFNIGYADTWTAYGNNCYFSNIRIVKGTAVYSSNFTPSKTPLTAITNTVLLTCQSNGFVDNSMYNATVVVKGASGQSVQKFSPFGSVTVPKYYSTYFNGSTDYLSNTTANLQQTGSFTVECWAYATALNATNMGIWSLGTTETAPRYELYVSPAGVPGLDVYSTGGPKFNITLSTKTWYHLAMVRDGTSVALYVNGTAASISSGSATQAGNLGATNGFLIGKTSNSSNSTWPGYISNLRVITGTALYTANFTPSTTPLTAVANTVLLTCQNSTFKDNSTNNYTITAATTTVKPLPVSPFTPTASSITSYSTTTFGGSMYFDGTGDYLTATILPFGTGDFTIESWFYYLPGFTSNNSLFQINTSGFGGSYTFLFSSYSGNICIGTGVLNAPSIGVATPVNRWAHFALVRSSGVTKFYLDGILQTGFGTSGSSTDTTNYTFTNLIVGGAGATTQLLGGYMADFRVSSTAVYTSNFYPGATPLTPTYSSTFLLTGTSGGIIDATRTVDLETVGDVKVVNGVSPYSGNYYSVSFNGSSDYLTLPANTGLNPGTGDFTFECWVYANSIATNWSLFEGKQNGLSVGLDTSFRLAVAQSFVGFLINDTVTFTTGSWVHVCAVRSGTNLSLYKNGTRVANSTSNSTNFTTNTNNYIGYSGANFLNGYISNLRLVKGTAVYDPTQTTISVPTTPLTAISGTQLLTCQSYKFIDNSTNAIALTLTGTPKVATQNPFQVNTGQSYYFDGTGDYLNVPIKSQVDVMSADFTAELWFYTYDATNPQTLLWFNGNTGSIAGMRLGIGVSSINFYLSNNSTTWTINSGAIGTLITGVWYHIAVVRSANNVKVYLDGTQIGTTYTAPSPIYSGTYSWIGALNYTDQSIPVYRILNGYISDLRITKGFARYTSSFTPPTAPLKLK